MCDLNAEETRAIVRSLSELDALTDEVRRHSAAIESTAFMDHAALAATLAELRDRAESVRAWVAAKPQQHAVHGAEH
ncbi:hypothetical protein ABT294_09915 [Nonomuraea sp. NPDC000554]|uniref:hypothetical protein n=1 Tax=Nonomuraea sp. NPDC000554 TaxID=3154259 RepID=UPI0033201D64